MARAKKDRPSAEIETGSFSDISFLLIIFFVLTTTLSKPTGRLVDVPSAAPPENATKTEAKTPTVRLFADRLLFGLGEGDSAGEEMTVAALKSELLALKLPEKKEKDRMVIVETAGDVAWERYFRTVTTIAECGGVVALVENEEGK